MNYSNFYDIEAKILKISSLLEILLVYSENSDDNSDSHINISILAEYINFHQKELEDLFNKTFLELLGNKSKLEK